MKRVLVCYLIWIIGINPLVEATGEDNFYHTMRELSTAHFAVGVADGSIDNRVISGHYYYNQSLAHTPRNTNIRFLNKNFMNNIGFIATANYFIDEEEKGRVSGTLSPTLGFFPESTSLIHGGIGITYDSDKSLGLSSIFVLTSNLKNMGLTNSQFFGSIFFQMDYYSNTDKTFMFGIAIGSGSLITITDL